MLKNVTTKCPICGEETPLYKMELNSSGCDIKVPVISNNGHLEYNWEATEIQTSELKYRCECCEEFFQLSPEEFARLFPNEAQNTVSPEYIASADILSELVVKEVDLRTINCIMMKLFEVEITCKEDLLNFFDKDPKFKEYTNDWKYRVMEKARGYQGEK